MCMYEKHEHMCEKYEHMGYLENTSACTNYQPTHASINVQVQIDKNVLSKQNEFRHHRFGQTRTHV